MSDCDSCSGCPASAVPGACGETKPGEALRIGIVEYEIQPELDGCEGCFAVSSNEMCSALASRHKCAINQIIFARKVQRLTPGDLDQLKKKAIELHAGVWLHHWGKMLEEEVLRRNGLIT